jgi:predicted RecA/RadA family phage recombinase
MTFTATFVHEGDRIDYTNADADTPAGSVVLQGALFGITTEDIPQGAQGALAVKGVFRIAKSTATGSGGAAGALAYWNGAAVTAVSTDNTLMGKFTAVCADADTTALVRLFT